MRQLSYYKQQIINQDFKIIPTHLDKIFLHKLLNNNCDRHSALEMIKSYFKLKTARSLSYEELENDEQLSELFRDSLNYFIDNFMSKSDKSVAVNKAFSTQDEHSTIHKLYTFLEKDKISDKTHQMLIYVKVPYTRRRRKLKHFHIPYASS
ncbi:MAG: hypothetical protein O7C59_09770 [Rickettsia endosymbiont of Ixodes persulcatus]|nr:hypothetical protein [Rickettsia endosymbiont of Ixodes persulcatus]MCZ6909510.1 hypothetical protein [Rickettsia endosymbiont of Ixodes persulcatus]MCZ6909587.1 hypothetical protein [Rickettsia endosymbiont of Ixodes persulcatus]MCZ6914705.1 hypothetical protein [Rickettsia endosymbiont of Ixodes persulcatus]MCZ6920017.1 hypothetical protein [Rickettsia endosymbiont of Ixodes persulcatus]